MFFSCSSACLLLVYISRISSALMTVLYANQNLYNLNYTLMSSSTCKLYASGGSMGARGGRSPPGAKKLQCLIYMLWKIHEFQAIIIGIMTFFNVKRKIRLQTFTRSYNSRHSAFIVHLCIALWLRGWRLLIIVALFSLCDVLSLTMPLSKKFQIIRLTSRKSKAWS